MPKFTSAERILLKSIVATLSIKRVLEPEIIKEIFYQTNKTVTPRYLSYIKQQIKKDSYHWYKSMREGQYEYIHEFKERINEITDLQKMHHEIINNDREPTSVKQTSLAELHRLNITLSNYFEVAPTVVNRITLPTAPESKTVRESETEQESTITV